MTVTATRTSKTQKVQIARKTTTLHVQHAFLYISLPSLRLYEVKLSNFTFYGGRFKTSGDEFFFLFLNVSAGPMKSTPGKFAYI